MQAVFTSLNKSSASARRGLTGYGQVDGLVCGLNYDNYEIA